MRAPAWLVAVVGVSAIACAPAPSDVVDPTLPLENLAAADDTIRASQLNLAAILADDGQFDAAAFLLRRLAEHPSAFSAAAQRSLDEVLRRTYAIDPNQRESVLAPVDTRILANERDPDAWRLLAELHAVRALEHDPPYRPLAYASTQTALEHATIEHKAPLHLLAAMVGPTESTRHHLREAAALAHPEDRTGPIALLHMGLADLDLRRFEHALDLLEAAAASPWGRTSPDVWVSLGVARRGVGAYDEAADAYRRAATLAPRDFRPWVNLGVLEADYRAPREDDYDDHMRAAIEAFEVAHELALQSGKGELASKLSARIELAHQLLRPPISCFPSGPGPVVVREQERQRLLQLEAAALAEEAQTPGD